MRDTLRYRSSHPNTRAPTERAHPMDRVQFIRSTGVSASAYSSFWYAQYRQVRAARSANGRTSRLARGLEAGLDRLGHVAHVRLRTSDFELRDFSGLRSCQRSSLPAWYWAHRSGSATVSSERGFRCAHIPAHEAVLQPEDRPCAGPQNASLQARSSRYHDQAPHRPRCHVKYKRTARLSRRAGAVSARAKAGSTTTAPAAGRLHSGVLRLRLRCGVLGSLAGSYTSVDIRTLALA
ncbi:hypothetical protein C2E23DRAFT_189881 [Lenzites betulinus]|nr:hypothetical protein C2E23DRAFT_189881 [Lenzites betulinus]